MGGVTGDAVEVGYAENHHLVCPFCDERSVLVGGQCRQCGGRVEAIRWRRAPEGFRRASPPLVWSVGAEALREWGEAAWTHPAELLRAFRAPVGPEAGRAATRNPRARARA